VLPPSARPSKSSRVLTKVLYVRLFSIVRKTQHQNRVRFLKKLAIIAYISIQPGVKLRNAPFFGQLNSVF
jgi:hypothetical protein